MVQARVLGNLPGWKPEGLNHERITDKEKEIVRGWRETFDCAKLILR